MPAPTTLLEYATQERDACVNALQDATAEFAAAQSALTTAVRDLTADAAAAAALERQIANKRTELAVTTVPAEAGALVTEITELIIEHRALQAQLLDREAASAEGRARVSAAQTAVQQAAARRTAAEAELAREQLAAQQRDAWKTALGQPPLSTLPATATATLGDAAFTAAEAEVNDLPEKIRDTATSRYGVYRAQLEAARSGTTSAEDLLAGEYGASGGGEGLAAQHRIDFDRAERAVRDFATGAAERHAAALALLATVADGELLSDAEKDEIDDPALVTPGESAADLGITRDDAQKTVDEKRSFLEALTLQQRAADPDADVTTVPAVQTAQSELDTATQDRDDAQTAFDPERPALAEWVAVVPDPAWRRVRAFLDARTILQALSAADPATLVTDLNTAEQTLAGALAQAAQRRRAVTLLREGVALRAARLATAEKARDARLLSAVRADS